MSPGTSRSAGIRRVWPPRSTLAERLPSALMASIDRTADFCHEADRSIGNQDANDGATFLPFAKVECDGSGNGEQGNHKALKLMEEDGDESGLLPRADRVCSIDH